VPLPLLGAAASDNDPGNCIDGSRMSTCTVKVSGRKAGRLPWISVEVQPPARLVHSLELIIFDPAGPTIQGGHVLGEYEVWVGDTAGELRTRCSGPTAEPMHDGVPVRVVCGLARGTHVTMQLSGEVHGRDRQIFLSELRVFTPAPPATSPPSPRRAGEVGDYINSRYENATPSGRLEDGGVLVHIYDGFESGPQPWDICHGADCVRGPVDTISSSLISRRLPWLFEAEARWGQVGFIIAPDVQVLCAFYRDAGSGGHPNGKCPFPPNTGKHSIPPHEGEPLSSVIKEHFEACAGEVSPFTGVAKRNGHCGSGYNEILVSWAHWELNLPWSVEAFMYGGGPKYWEENGARARKIHADFLQHFGLTRAEVPLLRYDCGPGGPNGGQPFTPATGRVGKCFVEV